MQYKSYKGDSGMREELLAIIEKNSRIDLKELAVDRKSTRLNSSHASKSRMPSSA